MTENNLFGSVTTTIMIKMCKFYKLMYLIFELYNMYNHDDDSHANNVLFITKIHMLSIYS